MICEGLESLGDGLDWGEGGWWKVEMEMEVG